MRRHLPGGRGARADPPYRRHMDRPAARRVGQRRGRRGGAFPRRHLALVRSRSSGDRTCERSARRPACRL
ncbi:hypothetical protein GB881_03920 [Georgenia subflava]|uniref:Uncharacterized protein n=1 Tax=Georgenia subflava TaxID=1622177 RepID=A0A6N7EFN4_9MICO|nr:hypothetical protein [Georgenia subflava]